MFTSNSYRARFARSLLTLALLLTWTGAFPGLLMAAPVIEDPTLSPRAQQAVQMLERVSQAQKRLDHILALAESGRTFTPAELLAFQAHVYRASQELDLAGKVVEKATGGVKQVLQTQL